MIEWLNNNSGFVTGISTVVLAVITGIYVILTKRILITSQEQFNLQREQYNLDYRPWIFISKISNKGADTIHFEFQNCGKLPCVTGEAGLRLYDKGDPIYNNMQESPRNTVIFPNKKVNMQFKCGSIILPKAYTVAIEIEYYSINDIEKSIKYSFYGKYTLTNIENGPFYVIESRAE